MHNVSKKYPMFLHFLNSNHIRIKLTGMPKNGIFVYGWERIPRITTAQMLTFPKTENVIQCGNDENTG